MRITCILCVVMLVITGICGGIFAFTGFNLLYYICFCHAPAYRAFLAVNFVAALFTVYSLIAFKPFKGLK